MATQTDIVVCIFIFYDPDANYVLFQKFNFFSLSKCLQKVLFPKVLFLNMGSIAKTRHLAHTSKQSKKLS